MPRPAVIACLALALLLAGAANRAAAGAPPRVAVDIAPVHALVARVMAGVGTPDLVLPPGVSPHAYALRPSEARMLAEADLVVRIGPVLAPWFERAVASLAEGGRDLVLAEAPGVVLRRASGHLGSAQDAPIDPHLWLDPVNARAFVAATAAALSRLDPANADTYDANADAVRRDLAALSARLAARLAPVRGLPYVVAHDAYGYFEERFGLRAVGAVTASDALRPGGGHVSALRRLIEAEGVVCLFVDPLAPSDLAARLVEGTPARLAALDPVGATLTPGPGLYEGLLRDLAAGFADCLGPAAEARAR